MRKQFRYDCRCVCFLSVQRRAYGAGEHFEVRATRQDAGRHLDSHRNPVRAGFNRLNGARKEGRAESTTSPVSARRIRSVRRQDRVTVAKTGHAGGKRCGEFPGACVRVGCRLIANVVGTALQGFTDNVQNGGRFRRERAGRFPGGFERQGTCVRHTAGNGPKSIRVTRLGRRGRVRAEQEKNKYGRPRSKSSGYVSQSCS